MSKLGQQDLIRLFVMPHTALEYNETRWSSIVQLLRHEKLSLDMVIAWPIITC